MELDDLRRQWQQPEAAPPPLTPDQLTALLSQRSNGLVDKMRRNARYEVLFTAVVAMAMPILLPFAHNFLQRAQAMSLLLLALLMLGYYYRKLALLHRMAEPAGHVRGSLQQLGAGLRGLLQFNYRLTLAMVPASLLLIYGVTVGGELLRPGGARLKLLLILGLALLATGLLLHWAAAKATRWYLQRLYGQHLDRLEGLLRELDEAGE